MDYKMKIQMDDLINELTDSLLSICTNVDIKMDIADLNYYKFFLIVNSLQNTLSESDKLADALSKKIPGLSRELLKTVIKVLSTLEDILNCINKDQSGVISYSNYKKYVINLKKDLLHHNDISFEAIEIYTEIYNQSR